jgi:Uri superfamily endonuclease
MTAPGLPTKSSADLSCMDLPYIPDKPGTYYLHLMMPVAVQIQVGRMGFIPIQSGHYIYCGSALGPGGLRARLGRHLSGTGRLHWHIDWLRREAAVFGCGYLLGAVNMECIWARDLLALPETQTLVPGFGASDCRLACPSHLVYFAGEPNLQNRVKWGNLYVWRNI